MDKEPEFNYQEISIWNLNSIINYLKDNFIQILLLILVFVIIYTVDYISNINTMIFSNTQALPILKQKKNNPKIQKPPKK
jgi:hypothetical protein